MSKSRDNKHRRQKAARKMIEWRARRMGPHDVSAPVEIVAVLKGTLPGSEAAAPDSE